MVDALLVTSSFLPGQGGIESYLDQFAAELAPRVAVMAAGKRSGAPIPEALAYPTVGHSGRMLVPSKRLARAVIKAAHEVGTDRIIFGTPWPLILLAPHLVAAGFKYSVILHGAELIVPGSLPVLGNKVARAVAGADLLLPVSEYTADRARELLEKYRLPVPVLEILRARVDLGRFSPEADAQGARASLSLGPSAPIVLIFGRLVPRKGADRLIQAMPAIAQQVKGTTLVIAGRGPEMRKLRRIADRTPARVIFAGRVPDDEAPGFYAAADVFVLPVVDRWSGLEIEGLGVVLLEAQASGTPCVTGTSGGTPEAVLDGVTGFVIDGADQNAIVDRTVGLLLDKSLAKQMGAAGREHVRTEFSERPLPEALVGWLI